MLVNVEMGQLVEKVLKELGEEYSVKEDMIKKNNVLLPAIVVSKKENPKLSAIYYPTFGTDIKQIVAEIKERMREVHTDPVASFAKGLTDKSFVLEHAWYRITIDQKYAEKYPHMSYAEDMFLIPALKFDEAMVNLTDKNLLALGISLEKFIAKAHENISKNAMLVPITDMMYYSVTGDESILTNLLYRSCVLQKHQLYVLSTLNGINVGASAIACPKVLEHLQKHFPDGAYVIPSSVEEVLILDDDMPYEMVNEMIRDVNREHVDPVDQLSNHVYRLKNGKIIPS